MGPREIGGIVGALIATFLLARLSMWVFGKFMGDTPSRIAAAYVAAVVGGVVLAGFGRANGGEPQFMEAAIAYLPCFALWLTVDVLAWRGRKAKRA